MIKHKKNSTAAEGADPAKVRASDWNDDHKVEGGLDLPLETVSTPLADIVRLFGGKFGGRMTPAFKTPDGSVSFMQPSFALKRVSQWQPVGNATGVTQLGMAASTTGTATSASVALTNAHTKSRRLDYLVTTAATTAVAAWYSNTSAVNQYCRNIGFFVSMRVGGATGMTTATHRFYIGMTSFSSTATDANPSTRNDLIGVGYDTGDTNFQLMHKTGSGAVTKVNLGASFPRQTVDRSKMYDLILYCPPGDSGVFYQFTDLETGAVASGEITTNLPTLTTLFKFVAIASVGGTSSVVGITPAQFHIETDY